MNTGENVKERGLQGVGQKTGGNMTNRMLDRRRKAEEKIEEMKERKKGLEGRKGGDGSGNDGCCGSGNRELRSPERAERESE
ncbi:hypothetical protein RUM43_003517 [Polyplax serrata]|uniref:Uncharacterized protein n=1 Tax=Polyplax serrata TaxID=468196 RepID=A0AAN8NVJ4_POLSC